MPNSIQILFNNKTFYIDSNSYYNPNTKNIFLYKDSDLKFVAYNMVGIPKIVNKRELDSLVNEGGAGYAVYGGSNGGYGTPNVGGKFFGRGSGFGQSSSSNGGPNNMYTYAVKPLNTLLQQPGTAQGNKRYIHNGCEIKGIELGTKKKLTGKVIEIKEDAERNVLHYLILDIHGVQHKLDPTSATLIHREQNPETSLRDIVSENFSYPSLKDFLNEFGKGLDMELPEDLIVKEKIYVDPEKYFRFRRTKFKNKIG